MGIPNIHWYGNQGNYNILVIDLLGPSIEDIFNAENRKFSLKTVAMLGDQLVNDNIIVAFKNRVYSFTKFYSSRHKT